MGGEFYLRTGVFGYDRRKAAFSPIAGPGVIPTDVVWMWTVSGPIGVALLTAAGWLFAYRRTAPRACRLAGITFLALLALHAGMVLMLPRFHRALNAGEDAAIVLWRYNVLPILSAVAQAAAVALLTIAVLSDRKPPAPPAEDDA
jgi:hypothetical protein